MDKLGTGQRRHMMRGGVVAGLLTLALVATACSSSPSTSNSGSGGQTTATYAEAAQTPPNYIFPFMSLAFFSVNNINQFQQMMYRPLYWFGNGNTPNLNPSLSLAQNPVYTNGGTTVTAHPQALQVVQR